ncbi:Hsp20/alpha crystallin family protein [Anaerorhabdus furcosa]|uniref:Molecular chaperone IbpA, HSP20 family n=1 Tax=Anaerorhabdus furcosa TaxID=118967 RepID=A0A1T4NXE8_9FIRM|nr:Hsp20/alpha crystallin family protein [Anaerorhabdus furcosa]SJZ83706.1 Molecular chaperone IbpA, HSP20 family [Anaerorhabdus furcosa]
MKLVPRNVSLFDEMFDDMFKDPFNFRGSTNVMKTDIKEKDGNYLLDIELPGFSKEDIHIELDKGTLTISATKERSEEEKDEHGHMIRQERFSGHCSRSYYVGDNIKEEDIKAKFENGELKLFLPNMSEKQIETKKQIPIE